MRSHLTFACLFVVACGGTTQSSDAGTGDGGNDTGNDTGTKSDGGNVDINQLGTPCQNDACPSGLEPVTYCGFTGCNGDAGQFCSCEIRCGQDAGACPFGTSCTSIADGPGEVCVKN